jgi:hypothetical protein
MSTQVQIRRGNTAQTATFTGSIAELTVDTDKRVVVVHDGTTAGGNPLIKANASITTGQILTSNGSHLLALSNTGTSGTYGNASFIPVVTTDAYGRVSSVTNTAIAISSGVVTGVMTFAQGGANATSYTTGGLLTSNGTSFVSVANTGTAGTYGNAAYHPVITTDAYGRVSAVTNTAISIDTAAITSGTLADARLPTKGTAGTYGNTTYIPVVTTDAYGRVTGVTNTAIQSSTTSVQGIVQLNDTVTSTSTSVAATANVVNATYNFAATKFNSSGGSITGTVSVTGNVYADNVIANSAFTSLGGTSRLQLTDIGLVSIQVAGVETKFGASGIENSPGIYGGSFGGNKLSLNSETNLISNRGDVVKIQTGTTGTAVNDFVFSNTSLTVPGGITANGFTAGGINVVPTLASSFSTANAAFTRANNSLNVNTGGSITGDVTVTGNLTIVGQTVYANTTTALIADNIVTLNAAINQASAPTVNAGIEVDRGSSTNTSLLWNETSDKWTFTNDGSTYYDIADAGRLDSVFSLANGTAGVANTDYTTISASAGVYGNASHVTVTTLTANGRVSSITNTAIAIDTAAITSGTIADARLPTKGTAGTYANSTYVPVITTDAYGRVTGVTNTAISFPAEADTLQTVTTRGSTTANAINVTNTTSSTSKTTGALVVAGGVGVAGDLFAGNSIVVDGGTYGNVTTTQFASVYGQAYGPNPYSIMQVRSSDFKTGMGIQVYSGLNGLLYSNTGIQFNTSVIARDKDFPTGGTNAGQFAANGAFIAQASLASTSNATGSIQVVGGVGVKGNVSADGIIFPDNTRQTTAATAGASIGDVLALSIALG